MGGKDELTDLQHNIYKGKTMNKSRRNFIKKIGGGLLAAAAGIKGVQAKPKTVARIDRGSIPVLDQIDHEGPYTMRGINNWISDNSVTPDKLSFKAGFSSLRGEYNFEIKKAISQMNADISKALSNSNK